MSSFTSPYTCEICNDLRRPAPAQGFHRSHSWDSWRRLANGAMGCPVANVRGHLDKSDAAPQQRVDRQSLDNDEGKSCWHHQPPPPPPVQCVTLNDVACTDEWIESMCRQRDSQMPRRRSIRLYALMLVECVFTSTYYGIQSAMSGFSWPLLVKITVIECRASMQLLYGPGTKCGFWML